MSHNYKKEQKDASEKEGTVSVIFLFWMSIFTTVVAAHYQALKTRYEDVFMGQKAVPRTKNLR